jgi:uncharacterized protein YkwD
MTTLASILSALIVSTSLFCSPAVAAQTGDLDRLRQMALELVNEERQSQGLEPLELGSAIDQAAQSHAEDMLKRDYYAHTSPDGRTVADRYRRAGGSRWHLTAENIARCRGCEAPPTVERIEALHQGWMNSPPHRENILRRGLDRFGFGIVVGEGDELYAVQTFAGAGTSGEVEAPEASVVAEADEQTRLALQRINEERRARGREPLTAAPALTQAAETMVAVSDRDDSGITADLSSALPAGAAGDWQSLASIAGRCGGCGTRPMQADIASFVTRWLNDPAHAQRLLDDNVTHLGFALAANGEGRKTASLILGQSR